MRLRDEKKKEAIFDATIALVNETGFAEASTAKIAKAANVSPATIYIYYKDKQDLLTSIYIEVKKRKSSATMEGFEASAPIKETFQKVWHNSFRFASTYQGYIQYIEQFANSPYYDLVDNTESDAMFQPVRSALAEAARQKLIRKVDFDMLVAFTFYPLAMLSNTRTTKNLRMTPKNIETAFEMAWAAIKL